MIRNSLAHFPLQLAVPKSFDVIGVFLVAIMSAKAQNLPFGDLSGELLALDARPS